LSDRSGALSRIVLEAFDRYWGPKPSIKKVTILIMKDPSARVAAVKSGRSDTANYEERIKGYRQIAVDVAEQGGTIPLLQSVITAVYKDGLKVTTYGNGWALPSISRGILQRVNRKEPSNAFKRIRANSGARRTQPNCSRGWTREAAVCTLETEET